MKIDPKVYMIKNVYVRQEEIYLYNYSGFIISNTRKKTKYLQNNNVVTQATLRRTSPNIFNKCLINIIQSTLKKVTNSYTFLGHLESIDSRL